MTEELSRGKPRSKVATMGHAGHGKTTLTAAINHVLSMKGRAKKESKLQGADVSRSEYESDQRVYEHVDAPTELFSSTATGAARFDGGILVVSVADGPMPQTREHILHAKQIGMPRIVVFLNFCDQVEDRELIELIELEARELLSHCGFSGDDAPVIKGSALKALAARSADDPWARKVLDLVASLDQHIGLSGNRTLGAPQVAHAPQSVKALQVEPQQAARSPGAVPSFTERLRDLFGRKRQE
ncbi:MAG TPA: GTP-binding protein [Burkholderiales bacterium]|jgi:elongation factor Tu|nr:GTP-binding protein [Burkholderiales bacterium]